jgi:hypothetical protein
VGEGLRPPGRERKKNQDDAEKDVKLKSEGQEDTEQVQRKGR